MATPPHKGPLSEVENTNPKAELMRKAREQACGGWQFCATKPFEGVCKNEPNCWFRRVFGWCWRGVKKRSESASCERESFCATKPILRNEANYGKVAGGKNRPAAHGAAPPPEAHNIRF